MSRTSAHKAHADAVALHAGWTAQVGQLQATLNARQAGAGASVLANPDRLAEEARELAELQQQLRIAESAATHAAAEVDTAQSGLVAAAIDAVQRRRATAAAALDQHTAKSAELIAALCDHEGGARMGKHWWSEPTIEELRAAGPRGIPDTRPTSEIMRIGIDDLDQLIAQLQQRAPAVADETALNWFLAEALAAAMTAMLQWTRAHPLLATLLNREPQALLPLLAAGDAQVIAAARPAIAEVLRARVGPTTDIDMATDLLARVMLSYAIDPPAGPPTEVARRLAALLVDGLA